MPPRKEEWRRKRRKAGGRILNEESMKAINKADTVIQRTFFPPFVWVKDSRRHSLAGNPSTVLFLANNGGGGRNVHPPPPPWDPL